MLEHVRDSVLKFKSYEITTCAIGYLRQTIMFPKNNDLMLNTRIKQVVVEVKNIMIKLETGKDSDNNKHNKHHNIHQVKLYKQCRNSEVKVITQIYLIRAQAEVSIQRL